MNNSIRLSTSRKIFIKFLYAFFILIAIITFYPFWYTLVASIIPFNEFAKSLFLIFPKEISLNGYATIFQKGSEIIRSTLVSLFSVIVGTTISVLASVLAGYVISRKDLPGRGIIMNTILITMLFSGGLIPLYLTLSKYSLIDSLWVYIFPGLINTFYVLIIKTHFQSLPTSLLESAQLDGANDFTILFRIILPISLPTIATITLFYAVDRWNDLYTAIFFINDAKKYNMQALLYTMVAQSNVNSFNAASTGKKVLDVQLKFAFIIIATLPILMIYPFLQKYFIKGALVGSIKE